MTWLGLRRGSRAVIVSAIGCGVITCFRNHLYLKLTTRQQETKWAGGGSLTSCRIHVAERYPWGAVFQEKPRVMNERERWSWYQTNIYRKNMADPNGERLLIWRWLMVWGYFWASFYSTLERVLWEEKHSAWGVEWIHQTRLDNQKIIQYLFAVQTSLVLVFIYYTIHTDNFISFINQKI